MKLLKTKFVKDVFYVVFAQIISLLATLVVSFIAPKFISVTNYSYWQLFLFYVTYVGIFRLGLIDGLYLRLAGKDYDKLNHEKLSCEYFLFIIFQVFLAILLFIAIILSGMPVDRKFVFGSCCVCLVIVNSNNYLSYILQTVNQTKRYSISVILQNLPWFLAVLFIFIFKIHSYKIIVIMYIVGHILAGLYLCKYTKEIWQIKKYPLKEVLNDIKENIKCGLYLMISTYAGLLVIGSSKMIIDGNFSIESFGYFSFAILLSNCLLTFMLQISLVVFPAVKKQGTEKAKSNYIFIRNILGLVLPIVLLGFFPISIFIKIWLPQYVPCLEYLIYLLPICLYDGKMNLLCNTYFKAFRKEKLLLLINVMSMIASITVSFIFGCIIKNISLVAISLLLVISIRSIVSEIILANMMSEKIIRKILMELSLVIIYIVSTILFNELLSFVIYLISYLIYLFINKNVLKETIIYLKNNTNVIDK